MHYNFFTSNWLPVGVIYCPGSCPFQRLLEGGIAFQSSTELSGSRFYRLKRIPLFRQSISLGLFWIKNHSYFKKRTVFINLIILTKYYMHTGLDLLLSDVPHSLSTDWPGKPLSEPTSAVQSDVEPFFRLCQDRCLKANKTLSQSKYLEITKKVIPFHQILW